MNFIKILKILFVMRTIKRTHGKDLFVVRLCSDARQKILFVVRLEVNARQSLPPATAPPVPRPAHLQRPRPQRPPPRSQSSAAFDDGGDPIPIYKPTPNPNTHTPTRSRRPLPPQPLSSLLPSLSPLPFLGGSVPSTPSPGPRPPLDLGHPVADGLHSLLSRSTNSPRSSDWCLPLQHPGGRCLSLQDPGGRRPPLQDPGGAPSFKIRQLPQVFKLSCGPASSSFKIRRWPEVRRSMPKSPRSGCRASSPRSRSRR
jgi:hypothetical protein